MLLLLLLLDFFQSFDLFRGGLLCVCLYLYMTSNSILVWSLSCVVTGCRCRFAFYKGRTHVFVSHMYTWDQYNCTSIQLQVNQVFVVKITETILRVMVVVYIVRCTHAIVNFPSVLSLEVRCFWVRVPYDFSILIPSVGSHTHHTIRPYPHMNTHTTHLNILNVHRCTHIRNGLFVDRVFDLHINKLIENPDECCFSLSLASRPVYVSSSCCFSSFSGRQPSALCHLLWNRRFVWRARLME